MEELIFSKLQKGDTLYTLERDRRSMYPIFDKATVIRVGEIKPMSSGNEGNFVSSIEVVIQDSIPEEFVGLANFMGIDKFIEFCNEYGGIAIYFPSKKTLLRNGRNREIIKRYNGKNIKDLARAFEISEVQVRNIIRTSGKCIN